MLFNKTLGVYKGSEMAKKNLPAKIEASSRSNRGEVDSNHRSLIRRSRQPPDLVEMSRLKEVGAMSRISHLDALTDVLSERPKHLRERLGLDRVLPDFQ